MVVPATSSPFLMAFPCTMKTKFPPLHSGVLCDTLPLSRSSLGPKGKTYTTIKCSDRDIPASEASVEPSVAVHFHPRIWEGHDFVSSPRGPPKSSSYDEERHNDLKKEVKKMLSAAANDPSNELDLVDKIQKLGVGYQFEAEIDDILQRTYDNQNVYYNEGHEDLYHISLRFRLLRQAGFHASSGIFTKYKDENGDFCGNLVCNVRGMLNLYEASYLSIHGEYILDEARAFATTHLKNSMMTGHLSPALALEVERALIIPLHHSVERVHSRHYISIYQQDESRDETLLEFAKLDFNILQLLHKKELAELSVWWDRIVQDVKPKLPFQFRDRLMESYLIVMGFNHEPQFSLARMQHTKLWAIATIFDDAHDVYGDIEELRPLRDAIKSFLLWNIEDLNKLADHMKIIFHEIVYVVKEIEVDMIRKRQFLGIPYLKKEILNYTTSIFEESTMIYSQELPTFEKWLSLSAASVGTSMFLCSAVMNLGEVATEEVFEWVDSRPDILNSVGFILRLVHDISSFQLERKRGMTASNQTCYMKQYGVSEQEAIQYIQMMVTGYWKDMNKVLLRPQAAPMPVLKIMLGLIRAGMEFYSEIDMYTVSTGRTKELVASLLRDPIPI